MIGNVAEWTASDWTPGDARKVVKGGSWNDVLKFAAPYSRWRYEEYKPVYDVGFRVKVEE
jgi:formylglycine-generating enzyme required for sulfatase activity